MTRPPLLPGNLRKNDALFMYGALQAKPFVYTYIQDRTEIVGGPSCRRDTEINTGQCAADQIEIIERRGGGGTVVLAPGMVITVIVGERSVSVSATDIFDTIHRCMIGLLSGAGVRGIVRNGISDLAIGNRKILGSSLYMGNRPYLYYYQSSLMVNPDLRLIDRYLEHPPREPGYRCGRKHRDFCSSLVEMGYELSTEVIQSQFRESLSRCLGDV